MLAQFNASSRAPELNFELTETAVAAASASPSKEKEKAATVSTKAEKPKITDFEV